MATPFESAQLNLQLFDLRREPVLRAARDWFLREFHPDSFAELLDAVGGERNSAFRMVVSYWEMAASLVTSGAIDADSFLAAHGEIFAAFSKIQPYLAEIRATTGEPKFCEQIESVVMRAPEAAIIMARRRTAMKSASQAK